MHLPTIVEAAEASPNATREAAERIRRILSNPKTHNGYRQYNAIMVMRILSDNPGPTFTRHIDEKFVTTVKTLLREGRDMSVQQMLRETLESLSANKYGDPNLRGLLKVWDKEKANFEKHTGVSLVSSHSSYYVLIF